MDSAAAALDYQQWSLSDIVQKMLQTPRSQLNFYASGLLPPSYQREVVSYRTTNRAGLVRRLTSRNSRGGMQGSNGDVVPPSELYNRIVSDVNSILLRGCFFTFTTAPISNSYEESENIDVRNNYQQLLPTPVRLMTA